MTATIATGDSGNILILHDQLDRLLHGLLGHWHELKRRLPSDGIVRRGQVVHRQVHQQLCHAGTLLWICIVFRGAFRAWAYIGGPPLRW